VAFGNSVLFILRQYKIYNNGICAAIQFGKTYYATQLKQAYEEKYNKADYYGNQF